MKKILLSVATATLGVLSFAAAQTSPSITDLLKDATFGYDEQNVIAVESIDTTGIHLRSPIIKYLNGDLIFIYRLTYSPFLIEDLASTTDPAILDQIKAKEINLTNGDDRVMLNLGVEDGLDPNQTYYAMVNPVDVYDEIGTPSEQICFNLSQAKYDIGDNCLVFDEPVEEEHWTTELSGEVAELTTDEHSAASSADLALANITHTISGNVITLRWTKIDGIDSMDIFVFDTNKDWRIRIWEVQMSAEKYNYTMTRDGEHIFNLKPLNGGKEVRYEVNAMRSSPDKPVITPPATGPVENTLVVLALSVLTYLGYRTYRVRKVEK